MLLHLFITFLNENYNTSCNTPVQVMGYLKPNFIMRPSVLLLLFCGLNDSYHEIMNKTEHTVNREMFEVK